MVQGVWGNAVKLGMLNKTLRYMVESVWGRVCNAPTVNTRVLCCAGTHWTTGTLADTGCCPCGVGRDALCDKCDSVS
jgi:hypothetical protein